jgi:Transglycosylase SLT domain
MTAQVNKRLDYRIKVHFKNVKNSLATTVEDIAQGFFEITHNGFALVGLAVVFVAIALTVRPDLRDEGEFRLMTWLQERQEVMMGPTEPAPAEPVAVSPAVLSSQQVAVASWISKKYSVAQEPVGALVAEAFEIGRDVKLDPTLILAIMAIESGFNPFAQSPVGAQGLMQVMTKVHHDKYQSFGGKLAAFDPLSNLRVGVKVLQECISRAGSMEGGLKYYVGAADLESDDGYANKVLAEHARLKAVVGGKPLPATRMVVSATPSRVGRVASPVNTAQEPDNGAAGKLALLGRSD